MSESTLILLEKAQAEIETLRGYLRFLGAEPLEGGGLVLNQAIYVKWYERERKRIEDGLKARIAELESEKKIDPE